ncbi:MAG: hypothetical protein U9R60_06075 [Bacteroidota bacterium]|nr:hypothetical protein [Bacteroidota bacterium]
MKIKKFLKYWSLIFGIFVTSLFLLAFLPKFIGEFIEKGFAYLSEIPGAFIVNWNDNPTAFFLIYIIGYALIWWKPLWGSIIIIISSAYYIIISESFGPLIFAIPTLLVGLSYLWYWFLLRKTT